MEVDGTRISIVGTGYVGLSTGAGFASKGNDVICVDIDREKIESINAGKSPIYEPGLGECLKEVLRKGRFRATADLKDAVLNSEISFISVPTPQSDSDSADLSYIRKASGDIGLILKCKEGYHVVVVKSTVVPGTTEDVVVPMLEKASGKQAGRDFGVCMNPEFLREGRALVDFLRPDRIVIGSMDSRAGDALESLYDNFDSTVLRTGIKTAEMIKYASNALLATKISFSNEIGNICKGLGIDVYDVMKGVGMDSRICPRFLQAGAGFGGSCFPKDVSALVQKSKELGHDAKLLKEVLGTNERQKVKIIGHLKSKMKEGGLKGKKIALLGLAFKPDTDDIREAPSISVIKKLLEEGAEITAHDPRASESMKSVFPGVVYAETMHEALTGQDAAIIMTDWDDYKKLSDKDFGDMKNRIILEVRKVLNPDRVKGFEGICWPGETGRWEGGRMGT